MFPSSNKLDLNQETRFTIDEMVTHSLLLTENEISLSLSIKT